MKPLPKFRFCLGCGEWYEPDPAHPRRQACTEACVGRAAQIREEAESHEIEVKREYMAPLVQKQRALRDLLRAGVDRHHARPRQPRTNLDGPAPYTPPLPPRYTVIEGTTPNLHASPSLDRGLTPTNTLQAPDDADHLQELQARARALQARLRQSRSTEEEDI